MPGSDALPPSPLPPLPSTPNAHAAARRFDLTADALFAVVSEALPRVHGWRIGKPQSVESSAEQRRLYAPYRVGLFLDDVLAAVEPLPDGGAALYLRSSSRVGVSDLGVNRARLEALVDAVAEAARR